MALCLEKKANVNCLKAIKADKELVRRNSLAQSNWDKIKKSLEKQQKELQKCFDSKMNKILKQRERIQASQRNLKDEHLPSSCSISRQKSALNSIDNQSRRLSLADVNVVSATPVRPRTKSADLGRVSPEPTSRYNKPSQSLEEKKVVRKLMGLTVNQQQRRNSNASTRLESWISEQSLFKDDAMEEGRQPLSSHLDRRTEADTDFLNPFPFFPPNPVTFPPIRKQSISFKPQEKKVGKDSKIYKQRVYKQQRVNNYVTEVPDSGNCSYLRPGRRAKSNSPMQLTVKSSTFSRKQAFQMDPS